ncbi:hypothetical protein LDENG_00224500 [Lucifuga dentata]|nr:hypothetical protein LDENG_00224500 [Lucifuga dentata]
MVNSLCDLLGAYGGARIKAAGCTYLKCSTDRAESRIQFFVIRQSASPILGGTACKGLNVVRRVNEIKLSSPATKEELVKQHPEVFQGLGEFPVQSDQKPLEAIFTKPLGQAPARLQCMLLQLQGYDFHIRYIPGKEMLIADALSRAFSAVETHEESMTTDEKVVYAMEAIKALGEEMHKQLKMATEEDRTSQKLLDMHQRGWPKHKKQMDAELKVYWLIKDKIRVNGGVLMTGDRFIIPKKLRSDMLHRLHVAHQGVQRTKEKACKFLHWLGMSADIEQMIGSCSTFNNTYLQIKKNL